MRITYLSPTRNGMPQPATQEWDILTAVGEPPQRSFQQLLYLRLATGGEADGLRVDASKTTFRATFKPSTYSATNQTVAALAAKITDDTHGTVYVELEAPRQVSQVQLANNVVLGSTEQVEFYRLDGTTLAGKATVTAGFGNRNRDTLAIEGSFALDTALTLFAAPRAPLARAAITQPVTTQPTGTNITIHQALANTNVADLKEDFTDVRFALRLKDAPATQATFKANQISSLSLRSYPSAPRLGLANPDDLANVVFFKRLEGEIGKAPQNTPGALNAQENNQFAAALQRYLDDYWVKLREEAGAGNPPAVPPSVDVVLVLASDAPCRIQISDFALEYAVIRHSFTTLEEKSVLRFAGSAAETQAVFVRLPKQATAISATLQVDASFGGDRLVAGEGGDNGGQLSLEQTSALYLDLSQWAGQPITPAQAISVSGLALGLIALSSDTKLLLALHEEYQGQPTGKKLVEVTVSLPKSGQRLWKTLRFPAKVILPTQPHWLLIKAVQGAALWLTTEGESTVSMFEASNKGTVGQTLSILSQTQTLFTFLLASTLDVQATKTAPLTLAVGTTPVTPANGTQPDTLTFDLTAALNAYTAAAAEPVVEVPLALSSGLPGSVTIYPPEVLFSLADPFV